MRAPCGAAGAATHARLISGPYGRIEMSRQTIRTTAGGYGARRLQPLAPQPVTGGGDGGPLAPWSGARLRAVLGLALATVAGLAALVSWSATVRTLDAGVVAELHEGVLRPLVRASLGLSFLASTHVAGIVTISAAAGLLFARRARAAAALALSVVGTQVVVAALKLWMSRPRPPAVDAATHAAGFSFPSGHSATAVAVYGTLAFLFARTAPRELRVGILATGVVLSLLIAASRVYLGVHYPTDVIAGWVTGAAVSAATCALLLRGRTLGGWAGRQSAVQVDVGR